MTRTASAKPSAPLPLPEAGTVPTGVRILRLPNGAEAVYREMVDERATSAWRRALELLGGGE